MISLASLRQMSTHFPHFIHFLRSMFKKEFSIERASHSVTHLPHDEHFSLLNERVGAFSRLSGLWHHMHLKGQPFKKTHVRIPSPSCMQNFCILNTIPFFTLCSPTFLIIIPLLQSKKQQFQIKTVALNNYKKLNQADFFAFFSGIININTRELKSRIIG